jgi:hypothetical protein
LAPELVEGVEGVVIFFMGLCAPYPQRLERQVIFSAGSTAFFFRTFFVKKVPKRLFYLRGYATAQSFINSTTPAAACF